MPSEFLCKYLLKYFEWNKFKSTMCLIIQKFNIDYMKQDKEPMCMWDDLIVSAQHDRSRAAARGEIGWLGGKVRGSQHAIKNFLQDGEFVCLSLAGHYKQTKTGSTQAVDVDLIHLSLYQIGLSA